MSLTDISSFSYHMAAILFSGVEQFEQFGRVHYEEFFEIILNFDQ